MNGSIDWPVVAVFLAMAIGAAALIRHGLRGRRVGDHPHCRRCGFDLFGAPPDATRCPECGADVARGRNVVVGRHERILWPFPVAAALLVLASLGFLGVGMKVDWRAQLPTAYVLYEARSGTPASRVLAIDDLLSRDAASPLSPERRVALARAIVALQLDPANVWKPTWGDWVAKRVVEETLPDAVRDAFLDNLLVACEAPMRTQIRKGSRPPQRVVFAHGRGGLTLRSVLFGRLNSLERTLTIDGVPQPAPPGFGTCSTGFAWGGTSSVTSVEASEGWRKLAPGPHAVEWSCPVKVYPAGTNDDPVKPAAVKPLGQSTLRWRGTVTVVDDDVRLIADAGAADAIRAAIVVTAFGVPADPRRSSRLVLDLDALPIDVAFDVLVQQGDAAEQRITTLQRKAGVATKNYGLSFPSVPLKPGPATLIFRASAEAARSTTDLFDIWDGEVRVGATVEQTK